MPDLPPPPDQQRDWYDTVGFGKLAKKPWRDRLATLTARPFLKRIERGDSGNPSKRKVR